MRKDECTEAEWEDYLAKTRVRLRTWRAANRESFNAARRADRKNNPAKRRKLEKDYRDRNKVQLAAASRLRRTGMTDEMFQSLVKYQDDSCAGCGRQFGELRRYADHDHDTKQPRGILCVHCNAIEGHAKKVGMLPGELGRQLDEYLKNPPAKKLNAARRIQVP